MNFINEKLVEKYRGIPLIQPSYKNDSEFYTVEDFKDFNVLGYYLGEVNDSEADITKDGINFLEEQFGLENLAKRLFGDQWYAHEYTSVDQIYEWLIFWKKYTSDAFKKYKLEDFAYNKESQKYEKLFPRYLWEDEMVEFLVSEVAAEKIILNDIGKSFIMEFFDLEVLSQAIFTKQDQNNKVFQSAEDLKKWLQEYNSGEVLMK